MLKRSRISILVTCAAIFASQESALAQPLAEHAAKLEVLGDAGRWQGAGEFRGVPFTCEMVRTWSEDKGAMFFTQRYFRVASPKDKEPVSINSGVFGWDAAKEKIKTCWFITDGRSATDYLVAEKNRLTGTRHLSEADGTETIRKVTLDLHPDGRIGYQSVDKQSGETVIEIEWTPVKKTTD